MKQITWLSAEDPPESFPPLSRALDEPPGLLAGGGDLSPQRLLAAYRRGIFPWFSPGQPVLWWSPDPREVLFPQEFIVSRSLRKTLRSGRFAVTRDRAFGEVIGSYECWEQGTLVGGLYGVAVGPLFCGESMFSRRTDASKVALAGLVEAAPGLGIALIDCQMPSAHLRSLGSRPLPRAQFQRFLPP